MSSSETTNAQEKRSMRSRADLHKVDLGFVLHPFSTNDFLSSYFGQRFLYIPGAPGKFTDVLPWSTVNDLLGHQYLRSFLRLVKDGEQLPTESYFKPHLSASAVTRCLRDGATLVLAGIDDMYEPVTILCRRLGRVLGSDVHANMYAGWRTTHGFDPHRDDHDVLILQLDGQKYWQVYGHTNKFPLRTEGEKPAGPPIWEGLLNDGDALYLPRGWWHVATPCDTPSLHLTVGLYNLNGIHLLHWITDLLKKHECMRMDIPRFIGPTAQAQYLAQVQQVILDECAAPDVLERFLRSMDLRSRPKSSFGLPWSAMPQPQQLSPAHVVELAMPRYLQTKRVSERELEIGVDAEVLTFDAATEPLFQYLNRGPMLFGEFCRHFEALDHEELELFISDLAMHGIVSVFEPEV